MTALKRKFNVVLLLAAAFWLLSPAMGWGQCKPPVEYDCIGYSVDCFGPCYCFTYYLAYCNGAYYEVDDGCCEVA